MTALSKGNVIDHVKQEKGQKVQQCNRMCLQSQFMIAFATTERNENAKE